MEKNQRDRLDGMAPRDLFRLALPEEDEATTPSLPDIPGFEIKRLIGRGGVGEVFQARQLSLEREVAIKVLRGHGGSGVLEERFAREARAMGSLLHPHIVAVHDFLELESGQTAIVMEYVEGRTLRAVLDEDETLPGEKVSGWGLQMISALEAAHGKGCIHRDLKPENILLNEANEVKITDFGIATYLEDLPAATRLTLTGTAVGTLGYMAPEQFDGGLGDARADIYSLGVVLYEMLTGRLPQGNFDSPRSFRTEIQPALESGVMKALMADPSKRFSHMGEFAQHLQDGVREPERSVETSEEGGDLALRLGLWISALVLNSVAVIVIYQLFLR